MKRYLVSRFWEAQDTRTSYFLENYVPHRTQGLIAPHLLAGLQLVKQLFEHRKNSNFIQLAVVIFVV